jgi:hypothetical protein
VKRAGWANVIVCASGPSLTLNVASICYERAFLDAPRWKIIVVNDAWRRVPFAQAIYTTDRAWWDVHGDIAFAGERWASQAVNKGIDDDKRSWGRAEEFRLSLVDARDGDEFSFVPGLIHYGQNSGFAAVNLALQFGATHIKLAGFDMQRTGGQEHFFGDHPPGLHNGSNFAPFIRAFETAAAALPAGILIENCTPESALRCFPFGAL